MGHHDWWSFDGIIDGRSQTEPDTCTEPLRSAHAVLSLVQIHPHSSVIELQRKLHSGTHCDNFKSSFSTYSMSQMSVFCDKFAQFSWNLISPSLMYRANPWRIEGGYLFEIETRHNYLPKFQVKRQHRGFHYKLCAKRQLHVHVWWY